MNTRRPITSFSKLVDKVSFYKNTALYCISPGTFVQYIVAIAKVNKLQGTSILSKPIFRAAIVSFFLMAIIFPVWSQENSQVYELSEVNFVDRALVFNYSRELDVASDFTQYVAFLSPGLLFISAELDELPSIALAYGTASLLSLAARFGLKAVVDRPRPYMYFSDPPQTEIAKGKQLDSFPSGHAIMAFSGAAFTVTVFQLKYRNSPYKLAANLAACGLAVATAGLRIASGSHFISDVLAGAILGSVIGSGTALLAYKLDLL